MGKWKWYHWWWLFSIPDSTTVYPNGCYRDSVCFAPVTTPHSHQRWYLYFISKEETLQLFYSQDRLQ